MKIRTILQSIIFLLLFTLGFSQDNDVDFDDPNSVFDGKITIKDDSLIIEDATGADSIVVYDDGTNAWIKTDNPLKIPNILMSSADLSNGSDVGLLNENETIAGNWLNTAYPWADNEVENNLTITAGVINATVVGGTVAAAGTFTTLNATGGGALTGTWTDLGSVSTVDINGGSIDNAVIGVTTPAVAAVTHLTVTGSLFQSDDQKHYLGSDQDFSMEYDEDGNDHVIFAGADINFSGVELMGSGLNTLLAQGLIWDESADTYTRTGSIADIATGTSAGDSRLIIQSAMRRCLLNDAGEVVYFLSDTNSAYTEFGVASDLTGTDGQVMVEIPKFYYKYSYSGTTHSWSISPFRLPGYDLHPAFYKNGIVVDYRYIGAYEGYVDVESGGKLFSITGKFPATQRNMTGESPSGPDLSTNGDATRSDFRAWAAARGTGWRQLDYDLVSAVQLLNLIEYASFYSQSMIGMGRTELSGGSWAGDSYIGLSGKSNGDGNGTNSVAGNTNNAYMTYRGVENFFGNIWKFVDGVTIDATANDEITDMPVWVTNDDALFADTGNIGVRIFDLTNLGTTNAGYQNTLEQFSRGFLPASVGAGLSTKITDYYWQYPDNGAGWRVLLLGAYANNGSTAGVFSVRMADGSAYDDAYVGGRVCF